MSRVVLADSAFLEDLSGKFGASLECILACEMVAMLCADSVQVHVVGDSVDVETVRRYLFTDYRVRLPQPEANPMALVPKLAADDRLITYDSEVGSAQVLVVTQEMVATQATVEVSRHAA